MRYNGTSLISYVIFAYAPCLCSQGGREMAADTVVLTVRIPVALQQQLDTVALKSPQLKIVTEP